MNTIWRFNVMSNIRGNNLLKVYLLLHYIKQHYDFVIIIMTLV